MQNALYFTYLTFCYEIFDHIRKRLGNKGKFNFKIYDVIYWETNNYNTHIAQYLKKRKQLDSEI